MPSGQFIDLRYRREIDGLRSIAVIPVILHHAHLSPFPGGFIGVDIFFVISGYLITTLLLKDLGADRLSIRVFYERRARRILPALFVVIAASIPFSLIWMFPLELNDFVQSIISTTLFSSNILFWLESGYFAAEAELKPLLHTWSLAVEEQYYILFPLMLALLWRAARKWTIIPVSFALIALISFASAMAFVGTRPDAVFYLLPFRAWELMVGSLAAFLLFRGEIRPNSVFSGIGLALIAGGLAFASDWLWPSYICLLPVFGTALIVLFAAPDRGVGRLLSLPVFVGVGLISYSAYLWHQPILAFMRLRSLQEPSVIQSLAAVLATFVLAALTWRYVERPFRTYRDNRPLIPTRTVVFSGTAVACLFVVPAFIIDRTDGLPERIAPSGLSFRTIESNLTGSRSHWLPCDTDITFKPILQEPLKRCVFSGAESGFYSGQRAILIGDSHATVLSGTLHDLLTPLGFDLAVMTYGGCPPFPGYDLPGRDCNSANEAVYEHIRTHGYDVILVASRAQLMISPRNQHRYLSAVPQAEASTPGLAEFEQGLRRLSELDAKVIYFDPVPEMPLDIGQYARKAGAFSADVETVAFSIPYADHIRRVSPLLDILAGFEDSHFQRISTSRYFCDEKSETCKGIEGGVSFYADNNHLNAFGVKKLLSPLEELIASRP